MFHPFLVIAHLNRLKRLLHIHYAHANLAPSHIQKRYPSLQIQVQRHLFLLLPPQRLL